MWTLVCILSTLVAATLARPQDAPPSAPASFANSGPSQPPVEILSQSDAVNVDGSFNYSYELSNGIKVQQSGVLRHDPNAAAARSGVEGDEDSGDIQAVEGSYSYTAPDGTVISLSYTADENGFKPVGDHLPVAPPVPADIQRALDAIPATDETPQLSPTAGLGAPVPQ